MSRLKDGHPMRQHLEQAARHSQAARARLEAPQIPEACAYIWMDFWELHFARTWNELAPNAISYREIEAWAALTRRAPRPWEIEWLRLLDAAWLAGEVDEPGSEHSA